MLCKLLRVVCGSYKSVWRLYAVIRSEHQKNGFGVVVYCFKRCEGNGWCCILSLWFKDDALVYVSCTSKLFGDYEAVFFTAYQ